MDRFGLVGSKARSRMSEAGLKMIVWVCLHAGVGGRQCQQVLAWQGGLQRWVLGIGPASSAQHFSLKYTMFFIWSMSVVRSSCEWVKVLSVLFCPGYEALSDAGRKAVFKNFCYWVIMQYVLVAGCSNFNRTLQEFEGLWDVCMYM